MNPIGNPFSQMLITFQPRFFFGRRAEIISILQGTSASIHRSFNIFGVKTIGKTTLLRFLCDPKGALHYYSQELSTFNPYLEKPIEFMYLDCYSFQGDFILYRLYEAILNIKNTSELDLQEKIISPGQIESKSIIREALSKRLHNLRNKGFRLILCLDHFDKAYGTMSYEDDVFLRGLTDFHPFIFSTQNSLYDLRDSNKRSSPLLNIVNLQNIGLLTETEAHQIISEPVKGLPNRFSEYQINYLLELAGRQPYLLIHACEHLFNLNQKYPQLPEMFQSETRLKDQIASQISSLDAIVELFSYFWSILNSEEQQLLSKLAQDHSVKSEVESFRLATLRKNALIESDLIKGEDRPFCELFRKYILGQEPSKIETFKAEDVLEHLADLDRRLLEYLLLHTKEVCSFEDLYHAAWKEKPTKRALEAAIHRVRKQLKEEGGKDWEYIVSVRGGGYKYVPRPN